MIIVPGSAPGLGPVVGGGAAPPAAVAAPAAATVAVARPGPGAAASPTSASAVPATASALSGRHLDADAVLETWRKMIDQVSLSMVYNGHREIGLVLAINFFLKD